VNLSHGEILQCEKKSKLHDGREPEYKTFLLSLRKARQVGEAAHAGRARKSPVFDRGTRRRSSTTQKEGKVYSLLSKKVTWKDTNQKKLESLRKEGARGQEDKMMRNAGRGGVHGLLSA